MNGSKYWDKAWSLVDGCTPVSEACDNCWLRSMNDRFKKYDFNKVTIRPDRLDIPLKTRKPTVFAVWSDLFHEDVPDEFIDKAIGNMATYKPSLYRRHRFIVLTKRPERMVEYFKNQQRVVEKTGAYISELSNIYFGTTAENQEQADKRIPLLLQVPGKKILSIEPLLSPIRMMAHLETCVCGAFRTEHGDIRIPCKEFKPAINGVILGGESGHNARPMHLNWVRDIRDQCQQAGVPFFVKQLHIDGKLVKDINEFPEDLRIRELPWRVK